MAVVKNNLRELRRQRGIAIFGIVALSGVSYSLISAVERWGLYPSPETRVRLANALGAEVTDIWPEPPQEADFPRSVDIPRKEDN